VVSGEAGALLAAALWSVSVTILTVQTRRIGAISVNAVRSLSAALFVLLLIPFAGGLGDLRDISASSAVAVVGSGVLAMGLGDSLYFASLPLLGVSRAVPISNGLYPLLALLIAAVWLDEKVTWLILLGTGLVIVGVSLLVGERSPAVEGDGNGSHGGPAGATAGRWQRGLFVLILACVVWAISTAWLKAGLGDLDVIAVGIIRIVINALILLPVVGLVGGRREIAGNGMRNTAALAAAGVLGIGIGSLFYVFAVQEAGAGRTAVLTSTQPLFALPLAVLFLREKITPKVVLGTALCILGIWFVA
jgi:drug/metabolite transporter (DMT)-like permease